MNRWWGPTSGFRWEQDALDYLRAKMADYGEPYRAWQTFTFTANNGRVRECDLLIAAPSGLFLVEIKSHPGRAANDGPRWLFRGPDRTRTIENPLALTDLKAKELKRQLEWARGQLGIRGGDLRIPFVQPVVFLSDTSLRCGFDDVQRINVYGRDELAEQTTLPGIWRDLLGTRPPAPRLDPRTSRQLDKLLHKVGLSGLRSPGKVGPLELNDRIDLGPGWEDYLASNPAMPGDVPRRVRVYVTSRGTNAEERRQIQRAAHREYLSLLGVTHEGIVRVESYSDELDAGPAIVFRHGADWQRLDLFMTERGAGLPIETRVEMVRQLAEAVDHAHRRNLYHRALSARSVYVEMDGRYPRLRIADWQTAAHRTGTRTTGETTTVTALRSRVEAAAQAYLAPEFDTPGADGVQLDLFGLGTLAYLLLTGRPPADDRRELAQRLRDDRTLVPSAVVDDMSTNMDDLVRGATCVRPADRFESVREFLDYLELVETELTDPEIEVADPLEAKVGTEIEGWKVEKVLGKGSTARALLVVLNDHHRVLKVALDDDAARRLEHEAAQLDALNETHDAHIVRLLDGPRRIGGRMVIATEYAGGRTLAQYLRREGPVTGVADLENLGEDLLSAVEHLDAVDVRHRDIKPDNLAVKELPKKGRRLMLFDFSLAGAGEQSIGAGTPPYLDPFLGGDRPRFDPAAERYAAAVTLHEMCSGEVPSWGDGVTDPKLLDEDTPQLWADLFDPNLRDGLAAFFRQALHRDAGQRFATVKQMRHAWTAIFAALDRPAPAPGGTDDVADPEQALRDAAARATLDTPLAAAGLPPRALSVAERQLGASTVGDLVDIPAQKVQRLRGVGLGTKNELVRQAREWRRRLRVTERADTETVDGTVRPHVDELVGHLLPAAKGRNDTEIRVMRIALALPGDDGGPAPLRPWATQSEVGKTAGGVHQAHVATIWNASRGRWKKLGALMKDLRDDVVEIIAGHGRVLEAGQVAVELLARRGCGLDDPAARLAYAHAAVRAAIETEESVTEPRLLKRRRGRGVSSAADGPGARVLVALCDPSDATAPNERDLLDYAERLGDRADALVAAETLPGGAEVRAALEAVPRDPDEAIAPMPGADLVGLAAAASRRAALTPRLELYPRDLPLPRALRLAQVGGLFGPNTVVDPAKVRGRVLARFPELADAEPLADRPRLRALLKGIGIETTYEDGTDHGRAFAGLRLDMPVTAVSYTPLSRSSGGTWVPGADPSVDTGRHLAAAAEHGGFLALKCYAVVAPQAAVAVAAQPGVTAVNVTAAFVSTLRAVVAERGRPRWETVVAADVPDASPAARVATSASRSTVPNALTRSRAVTAPT